MFKKTSNISKEKKILKAYYFIESYSVWEAKGFISVEIGKYVESPKKIVLHKFLKLYLNLCDVKII